MRTHIHTHKHKHTHTHRHTFKSRQIPHKRKEEARKETEMKGGRNGLK